MSDFILIEGDIVAFDPVFGLATVVVMPGQLAGHGAAMVQGKKMSVLGDEKEVSVAGCNYITAIHTIPGVGTLTINSLTPDQIAQKTYTADKNVLLKGSQFIAKFSVQAPAQQPPPGPSPPIPDTTFEYVGTGRFINTNVSVQGS
jgi:hypothetical protein